MLGFGFATEGFALGGSLQGGYVCSVAKDFTLKDRYLELYVCSVAKDACISEVLWTPKGGTFRVWDVRFFRTFEDWELAASYSLLHLIHPRTPQGDRRDTL